MTQPIRADRRAINRAKNRVAAVGEELDQLQEKLTDCYFDMRPRMGESQDLRTTDERYEAAMNDVKALQQAVDGFADCMLRIRKLYRAAQERAIERAMQIPRE